MRKNLGLYIVTVYALVFVGIQLLVGIYIGYTGITFEGDEGLRISLILNIAVYSSIWLIYLITLKGLWKHQINGYKENFKRYSLYIGIGFSAIMGTSVIVSLIYSLLEVTDTAANQEYWEQIMSMGGLGMFSLVGISVIMAPLVEEVVFRYAGFRLLNRFFKAIKVELKPVVLVTIQIIITSFLFGYIHVAGDDMVQIIYYMTLGILLGFSYYKSKNILVPIGIHMAWNLFVSLSMFITL